MSEYDALLKAVAPQAPQPENEYDALLKAVDPAQAAGGSLAASTIPNGAQFVNGSGVPISKAPEAGSMQDFWDTHPAAAGAAAGMRSMGPLVSTAGLGATVGGIMAPETLGLSAPVGAVMGMGAGGIYNLGSMAVNGITQGVVNPVFGTRIPPVKSLREATDAAFDSLGVPQIPNGTLPKYIDIAASGAGDAFMGGPMLGRALAPAVSGASTIGKIAGAIQEAPVMQTLGGASGSVAAESLPFDPTDKPWLQAIQEIAKQGAGLLGGHIPGAIAKAGHVTLGTRALPQNFTDQLRASFLSRAGTSENEANRYINAIKASSPISAAIRGLGTMTPVEAWGNNAAFNAGKKNIAAAPIDRQAAYDAGYGTLDKATNKVQFPNEIDLPGFKQTSIDATGDAGAASALKAASQHPRFKAAELENQRAIARASTIPLSEELPLAGSAPAGLPFPYSDSLQTASGEAKIAHSAPAEAAAKTAQAALSANEPARDLAAGNLEGARSTYDSLNNSDVRRRLSSELRSLIDTKDAAVKQKYLDMIDAINGNTPIDNIAGLPEAIKAVVDKSTSTGGAPIHPDVARLLGQFSENHGVSYKSEPGASGAKVSDTVIPVDSSASPGVVSPEMSGIASEKLGKLPEAKPGQTRALPEGDSGIEQIQTPSGKKLDVKRELVPLADLIRADVGDAHPGVEGGMQNRNRNTVETKAQVQKIISDFNPELISGKNASAVQGAPVVDGKNVVEGGHARLMALEEILSNPKYADKKAAYLDHLKKMGYDVSAAEKTPMVEVQRRQTPLSPEEQIKLVSDMNTSPLAGMSSVENARNDAVRMNTSGLKPGGLTHPDNRDFLLSYARDVLSGSDYNQLIQNGEPNADFIRRAQNALNVKAYGANGGAAEAVNHLIASPEPEIKSIGQALSNSAEKFVRLNDAVSSGKLGPEYDLGKKVAEAASVIKGARENGEHPLKNSGQTDMFGGGRDPVVDRLVELMYGGAEGKRQMGSSKLTDALSSLADGALEQAGLGKEQGGLGLESPRSPEDLIKSAMDKSSGTQNPIAGQLAKLEGAGLGKSKQADALRAQLAEAPPVAPKMQMSSEASMGNEKPAGDKPPATTAGAEEALFGAEEPESLKVSSGGEVKPFTVGDLSESKKWLNQIVSHLSKDSAPGSSAGSRQAQTLLAGLDEIISRAPEGSPLKDAAQFYKEKYAPLYRSGKAKGLHEGVNGVDRISPETTADKWLTKDTNKSDVDQFVKMGQGDPAHIQGINDFLLSDMASSMKTPTADAVDRWIGQREHILNHPDLAATKAEMLAYRDKLQAAEAHLSDMRKDRAPLKKAASEAESALSAAKSEAENLPIVKVANGTAGVKEVLQNPALMRQAAAAAKTPSARLGLENAVKDHLNRMFKTNEQIPGTAIKDTPSLYDMFADGGKITEFLTHPDQIESTRILLGDDAVKQLQLVGKAVRNESFRSALTGEAAPAAPHSKGIPETGAEMIPGAAGFPVRAGLALANNATASKTSVGKNLMVDIALNPKLLAEFVRATKLKDPKEISEGMKYVIRKASQIPAYAGKDKGSEKKDTTK